MRDLRAHGDELWSRFNAPREYTLWYYRSLVTAYQHNPDHTPALVDELDRASEPGSKGAIVRREGLYSSATSAPGSPPGTRTRGPSCG